MPANQKNRWLQVKKLTNDFVASVTFNGYKVTLGYKVCNR